MTEHRGLDHKGVMRECVQEIHWCLDPWPYYEQDGLTLYQGDVLATLAQLPADSVDCVVTSPPYWSLRKYSGEGAVWGGADGCAHEWTTERREGEGYTGTARWQHSENGRSEEQPTDKRLRDPITRETRPEAWTTQIAEHAFCPCGAWRGQYGLEPTPEMYVEHTVTILRAIRRVLKPSGVVFWNIGDGYSGSRAAAGDTSENLRNAYSRGITKSRRRDGALEPRCDYAVSNLKPKDMIAMPWRVGLAAQADGWWLRADIIWAKPNPMPESVRDRPTKSHEYVLLLTKSQRYFWDADAVREGARQNDSFSAAVVGRVERRNVRSVWNIPKQPSPLPHFASFPEALAERCIKAGTPADGVVLDPFGGTGTTLKVARDLGRAAIGIEISAEYCELARKRLSHGIRGVMAIVRGQQALL